MINVIVSTAAVGLYCVSTYFTESERPEDQELVIQLDYIQQIFAYFFLIEFFIRLYAAESPSSHLRKPLTIIDIFTVFPGFLGQFLQWVTEVISDSLDGVDTKVTTDDLAEIPPLDFLRVVRLMRLLRIITFVQGRSAQSNDVSAHILRITLTFITVMICFAGFFMEVTDPPPLCRAPLTLHPGLSQAHAIAP